MLQVLLVCLFTKHFKNIIFYLHTFKKNNYVLLDIVKIFHYLFLLLI